MKGTFRKLSLLLSLALIFSLIAPAALAWEVKGSFLCREAGCHEKEFEMKGTFRKLSLLLSLALIFSLIAPAALAWEVKGSYTEGMATVSDGSAWGYVNASGIISIPVRFEDASDFSLGVALVKEDGKYGLLRQDGLFLLEPLYDSLTSPWVWPW